MTGVIDAYDADVMTSIILVVDELTKPDSLICVEPLIRPLGSCNEPLMTPSGSCDVIDPLKIPLF